MIIWYFDADKVSETNTSSNYKSLFIIYDSYFITHHYKTF